MRAARVNADRLIGTIVGGWYILGNALRTRTGARQFRATCVLCAHEHVTQLVNLQRSECSSCRARRASLNDFYASYVWNAQRRGFAFEIDRATFMKLVSSACVYCGDPPNASIRHAERFANAPAVHGVDRQNNTIGYTLTNSVTCCAFCNFAKHDRPVEEFRAWLERLIVRRSTCVTP